MEWVPVYSHSLLAVAYVPEKARLFVRFRKSPYTYGYYGVPRSVFDGLLSASSKGRYYQRYVRGKYVSEKYY